MRISAPQLSPQYITVSNSCQAENKKKRTPAIPYVVRVTGCASEQRR